MFVVYNASRSRVAGGPVGRGRDRIQIIIESHEIILSLYNKRNSLWSARVERPPGPHAPRDTPARLASCLRLLYMYNEMMDF